MVGLATDAAGRPDAYPVAAASDSDSDVTPGGPGGKAEEDDLSPEDAAWVDSCLVKDEGDGGEGWGDYSSDDARAALTAAFVAALAYSASGTDATTIPDEEEKLDHEYAGREASPTPNASGDELMSAAATDGLLCQDDNDALIPEEPSSPTASTYAAAFYEQPPPALGDSAPGDAASATVGAQFQGTREGSSNGRLDAAAVVIGNEFPEERGGYGDGEDDEFSIAAGEEVGEVLELTRGVFRVWELDLRDKAEEEEEEEDEGGLGWQLKKALEGSSVGAAMPPLADLDVWNSNPNPADLDDGRGRLLDKASAVLDDDQNLQDLIAGINDMSLEQRSSSPPSR